MKFMITWKFHPGKLHETLARFAQMSSEQVQALMGNDVKLVGRWPNLVGGCGVCIVESHNPEAVSSYCLNWNSAMDLNTAIVLDDAETRALGKSMK